MNIRNVLLNIDKLDINQIALGSGEESYKFSGDEVLSYDVPVSIEGYATVESCLDEGDRDTPPFGSSEVVDFSVVLTAYDEDGVEHTALFDFVDKKPILNSIL